jgi:hypothetical protein
VGVTGEKGFIENGAIGGGASGARGAVFKGTSGRVRGTQQRLLKVSKNPSMHRERKTTEYTRTSEMT